MVALGIWSKDAPITSQLAAVALAAYYNYNFDGDASTPDVAETHSDRLAAAASMSGLSRNAAKSIVEKFQATGSIPAENASLRGGGSPLHLLNMDFARRKFAEVITDFVEQQRSSKEPAWVTRMAVQALILTEYDEHVSIERVGRLMKALGLAYGKMVKRKHGILPSIRQLQRQFYIIQLENYLTRGFKVYCTDESCANAHLVETKGWARAQDMTS